ncbi:molybdopterin converting factor subunit 1 [Parasphingorhabdus sp. JC815]|uniref:molybdopterin converting factor subunit 1 n=1 Tax=Parasphingorhabdus sp. JC815 TaxID=3232140 RepID=UPI00345A3C84
MPHQINIVYFAWVKERLGRDQETVAFPETIKTVEELVEHLRNIDVSYFDVFSDLKKLRFALDHDFVGTDHLLASAKELAIFPPVTGG